MLVSTAKAQAIFISYLSILFSIAGSVLSFIEGAKRKDEKSMSTVIFIVMWVVQCIGAILVLAIWQKHRIHQRRMKEVQSSIVLGGLMIFMGFFFIEDGIRDFSFHALSPTGRELRIFSSCAGSISGYGYNNNSIIFLGKNIFGYLKACFRIVFAIFGRHS